MIPFTPDNHNRPAIINTEINITNGSVVVATSVGTLNSITIKSVSPGAVLFVFDNATSATGLVLSANTNLGAALAAGLVLNFGQPFANGITILVSGTVDAVVSWYPG